MPSIFRWRRQIEARLRRLEDEMVSQADFQVVLGRLTQAVADVRTRVDAKLADLQAQIDAHQSVDLTTEAEAIHNEIGALTAIVPAA